MFQTSNFWQKVLVISGFLVVSGLNLDVANAYTSTKYVNKGGCYLQKEYNYFMNQWTTNEVCKPKFKEVANPESDVKWNGGKVNTYLDYNDTPAQVTYYTGPSLDAIHTAKSGANSWNGTGSSAGYLLGTSGYYNSYSAPVTYYTAPSYSYSYPTYSSYGSYGGYGYYDTLSTYYPSYDYSYDYYGYVSDYGTYNGNTYATVSDGNNNSVTYCADCSYGDLVNMADGGLDW